MELEILVSLKVGIDNAQTTLIDLARKLGLDPNESIRLSYLELYLERQ